MHDDIRKKLQKMCFLYSFMFFDVPKTIFASQLKVMKNHSGCCNRLALI